MSVNRRIMNFFHVRRPLHYIVFLFFIGIMWFMWRHRGSLHKFDHEMVDDGEFDLDLQQPADGLTFSHGQLYLNRKPFRILSGAMHYFRVPEQYWVDRMRKMKACGLNTLETYVAWNLHEPTPGHFVYIDMLNISKYIAEAGRQGLYVILRPGPYICSEWDFGGLPSWLLADRNMKVRSNYSGYRDAVSRFFTDLLPRIGHLQLMRHNGVKELLMTSDGVKNLPMLLLNKDILPTMNFKDLEMATTGFTAIRKMSKIFPLMVMEFWSGWFDHWGERHNVDDLREYERTVSYILSSGASINFYMFHGGTNFGFMAGANHFKHYKPDVTSYDYDAPLTESGDITDKYLKTRELLMKHVYKPLGFKDLPTVPANTPKSAYGGTIQMEEYLEWKDLTAHITKRSRSRLPLSMESYSYPGKQVQSYGYIVYRTQVDKGGALFLPGSVHDRTKILLNGQAVAVFNFDAKSFETHLNVDLPQSQLDIVVENLGRVNFVNLQSPDPDIINKQRKGMDGGVTVDGRVLHDWTVLALDFNADFLSEISVAKEWKRFSFPKKGPMLLRASLVIDSPPHDTFINMKAWHKGVLIVNGRNLGRYWELGPQRTLFLPGPFLRVGKNDILVFEEEMSMDILHLQTDPILG